MMDKKLTPKQKAFADYYIETGNATEAARKAGYKGKLVKTRHKTIYRRTYE